MQTPYNDEVCEEPIANALGQNAYVERKVNFFADEYDLACQIMSLVKVSIEAKPHLNTCAVRRLCELMLDG